MSELRVCAPSLLKTLRAHRGDGVGAREELACKGVVVREDFLEVEASGGGGRWVSEDAQDRQGAGTGMSMGSKEQWVGVEPEGREDHLLSVNGLPQLGDPEPRCCALRGTCPREPLD